MKEIPDLRKWQNKAMDSFLSNGRRGCLEVATGGGKTTFALAAFSKLLKIKPDLRILVIVPTKALADQWFVNFEEDLGIEQDLIKVLSSRDLIPDSLVNIAIINTARGFNGLYEDSENLFLVVDECHRAGSNENQKAMISGTYASLGLSATPFREFDEGFQQYIEPILGSLIFSYSLDDAIRDGVLSDMKATNIRVPLLPSEQQDYDDLSGRIARAFSNNAEQGIIESLLRQRSKVYNNAFYRIPTILSIMEQFRGTRSLIFLESIDSAEKLHTLLEEHHYSVTVYHSKLSSSMRRLNLKLFRKGVYDTLIACRALDEGFNVPEARVAIIGAGTSSKRQRVQRMGRVLRSMIGKEKAEVITIYATDVEEARLVKESEALNELVEVVWRSVQHDK